MGSPGAESATTRTMGWTRTIDRRLVHRDAIAEVLLTDLVQLADRTFEVAAQWPRSHRVYRPDSAGRHDPMLILETVRQAGLALSHFGFGVDFEQQSVMRDVGFNLDAAIEPRALTAATNLEIAVRCEDVVRRGNALRSMTVVLDFAVDGASFATGTGGISWVSPRTYQALRARTTPQLRTAVESARLGGGQPRATRTRSAADALIAPSAGSSPHRELVIPLNHPVYFDHPLDHAPGMLLIDAAWQAAAEWRGTEARLVGASMQCPAFTELNQATSIKIEPGPGSSLAFSVEQSGRTTAWGTFQLAS